MKRYNLEEKEYGRDHMVYWEKSLEEAEDGEWVKFADLPAAAPTIQQEDLRETLIDLANTQRKLMEANAELAAIHLNESAIQQEGAALDERAVIKAGSRYWFDNKDVFSELCAEEICVACFKHLAPLPAQPKPAAKLDDGYTSSDMRVALATLASNAAPGVAVVQPKPPADAAPVDDEVAQAHALLSTLCVGETKDGARVGLLARITELYQWYYALTQPESEPAAVQQGSERDAALLDRLGRLEVSTVRANGFIREVVHLNDLRDAMEVQQGKSPTSSAAEDSE